MTKAIRTAAYLTPLLSVVFLLLITNTTDPISGGPAIILLVFILLYILCASAMFIILHAGVRLVSRIWASRSVNLREWKIGVRRAYYIASVVAFGPVLLLAMQSVGQLQLRDVALVSILLILAIFYVVKRS